MSSIDLLDRAKQGDSRAIAALLNHHWMAQGIKIRTRSQANHLDILLESEKSIQQDDLVAMVRQALTRLAPASIHTVKLYGKLPLEATPRWSQEWTVPSIADDTATPSQPPKISLTESSTESIADALPKPAISPQYDDLVQAMTRHAAPQAKLPIKPHTPVLPRKPSHPSLPTQQRRMPSRAVIFMVVILAIQVAIVIAAILVPKPRATVSSTNPQTSTPVVVESAEVRLAKHLKARGAKMYGTYWCGVCTAQKQLFGTEAFSQVDYIECDPRGLNPQPDLCSTSRIDAYPTWEIGGQLYVGGFNLDSLADLSNYSGPRNFTAVTPW